MEKEGILKKIEERAILRRKKFSYKGDSKNKKEDKGSWGIFQKGWEVLIFGGRKRDVEMMREERRREHIAQEEEIVREWENVDFGITKNSQVWSLWLPIPPSNFLDLRINARVFLLL